MSSMDHLDLAGSDPVRRTYEIEDPTNLYFIHPISARLVPIFAKAGITPNAVSLIGMGCGLGAGLFYHFYWHTGCDLAAFVLMLAWHVMDGADGQLARLTKTYSELGKVLDGICDAVTFTAVYVGLGLSMDARLGGWVWIVIAIAGLCHELQSAAYELQRQNYNFWGLGQQSAALPVLEKPPAGLAPHQLLAAELHRLYVRVQFIVAGGASGFYSEFAAMLAARPALQPALRAAYRARFAPSIRRWGVLSANYRTLGIFLCVVLKLPSVYFLFDIFGFSLILILLLEAQKVRQAGFLKEIRQAEGGRQPLMPTLQ